MQSVTMTINGMSCGHCVASVQRALKAVAGVQDADVKIGAATVRFDPATASMDQVKDAVEDAGYEVAEAK
jgi:copper chaperone